MSDSELKSLAKICIKHKVGHIREISAPMLQSIGVNTVILGHSERRAYFNETDLALADKVNCAIEHDMEVIFCFGEELQDRKSEII